MFATMTSRRIRETGKAKVRKVFRQNEQVPGSSSSRKKINRIRTSSACSGWARPRCARRCTRRRRGSGRMPRTCCKTRSCTRPNSAGCPMTETGFAKIPVCVCCRRFRRCYRRRCRPLSRRRRNLGGSARPCCARSCTSRRVDMNPVRSSDKNKQIFKSACSWVGQVTDIGQIRSLKKLTFGWTLNPRDREFDQHKHLFDTKGAPRDKS